MPEAAAEAPTVPVQWADDNPEELGRVHWRRGYEAALAEANRVGKLVFVLFDEVPGCSTVKAYGRTVLSDPLVVDAIESNFVPVVVYNNVEGADRDVLNAFGEPTWNNPVVRFVDAEGRRSGARVTHPSGRAGLLQAMADALGPDTPPWLALVAHEAADTVRPTATYAMGCFWSGEVHLGAHAGVVTTDTGFAGGSEVVTLTYDPRVVSRKALDRYAAQGGARPVLDDGFRGSPKDDRYQLRRTAWASVPMTRAQATKVNAEVGAQGEPRRWLSPRQQAVYDAAVRGEVLGGFGGGPYLEVLADPPARARRDRP